MHHQKVDLESLGIATFHKPEFLTVGPLATFSQLTLSALQVLADNVLLKGNGEEEDEGLLFVGDGGKILCKFNGGNPKLIPQTRMDSYK